MQGCVPFFWMCAGHVTYLVNKKEQKCSRLQGHMGKIHILKRMNKKKEEKENSANFPPGAQRMPHFSCGALEMSKNITDPTKYQWAQKEQALYECEDDVTVSYRKII